ncbi:hypothetical protein [Aquimarina sp. AU119]|uniref:hypothetical protein n=1 Tax=Aquimarina sp. AU119 TaxID=2108528 RepID=UPI000D68B3DC|nr:hypothetical protein [Aquimarina sp. AU119]
MKSNRHIVASIFLILFSFIQLADLHVLGHDANDIDCNVCQMVSENPNDGYISTEIIEIPSVITIPANVVRIKYVQQYFDYSSKYSFLNKAPPAA